MAFVKGFVIFAVFNSVYGMFLDDNPCDLWPHYDGGIPENSKFVTSVNVPSQCVNGTFRWDYPRGHVMLHFPNVAGETRKVCFEGGLIANAFTLVDVTDAKSYTLPEIKIDSNPSSCTHTSTSEEILVRVDAPPMLLYVAIVDFHVE